MPTLPQGAADTDHGPVLGLYADGCGRGAAVDGATVSQAMSAVACAACGRRLRSASYRYRVHEVGPYDHQNAGIVQAWYCAACWGGLRQATETLRKAREARRDADPGNAHAVRAWGI